MNLRVMNWNIGEGGPNGGLGGEWLDRIAEVIRGEAPDVVLLNEIRWFSPQFYPPGKPQQAMYLAALTHMPHWQYHKNVTQGVGYVDKGVAILSRHPLRNPVHYAVEGQYPYWLGVTKCGTLRVTMRFDGLDHYVYSLRFAPDHPVGTPEHDPKAIPDNIAGHQQLTNIVQGVDPSIPIILGGDFNADWHKEWARQFRDDSGLFDTSVTALAVAPGVQPTEAIDRIFYRRHYYCVNFTTGDDPTTSDHGYQIADLTRWDGSGSVVVPDVRQLKEPAARQALRSRPFRVVTAGPVAPNSVVTEQHPQPPSPARADSGLLIGLRNDTGLQVFTEENGWTPRVVWDSGPGNWEWSRTIALAGDFTGGGHADIAAFYNYPGARTGLWLFSESTGWSPQFVWDSGSGNWEWVRMITLVGNFTGGGHADIAALYNYPGARTGLWLFSESTGWSPRMVWDSGPGNWEWGRTAARAGDFTGGGHADIAALYDYSDAKTGLWLFTEETGWSPRMVWDSGPGNWVGEGTVARAGGFTRNGHADIAALYHYPDARTGLFLLQGETGWSPRMVWDSGPKNWELGRARTLVGDFTGSGHADLAVLYNFAGL